MNIPASSHTPTQLPESSDVFRTRRVSRGRLPLLATLVVASLACGRDSSAPVAPVPTPVRTIGLSPSSVTAGDSDVTVKIKGLNFVHNRTRETVAIWNGEHKEVELATVFVSDSELTTTIPAALISSPLCAYIGVSVTDPRDVEYLPGAEWALFDVTPVDESAPRNVCFGRPDE